MSVYTKMEKMVKNTATTIPTPRNTTQHLLVYRASPIDTSKPPFETHTPKTFSKLAVDDNIPPRLETTQNDSNPPERRHRTTRQSPRHIPVQNPKLNPHWSIKTHALGCARTQTACAPTMSPRPPQTTNRPGGRPDLFPHQPPGPYPN